MADWNWYLSIAAIRDLMHIAGLNGPAEEDNPAFLAAERMLGQLSLTARKAEGAAGESGADLYRTDGSVEINGRRTRLEFRVSAGRRAEGELPQVLRVRDKGASRPRNTRDRAKRRQKGSDS